jgi:hypothetical protein
MITEVCNHAAALQETNLELLAQEYAEKQKTSESKIIKSILEQER